MSNQEEYRLWGRDPLSAEINSQIRGMPDRPKILLAIIRYNKTAEQARFRELAQFQAHFMSEFPYVIFDSIKAVVTLFGFDSGDGAAFMGALCSLDRMNIDEAVIIEDGKATLRVVQLVQSVPPSHPSFEEE